MSRLRLLASVLTLVFLSTVPAARAQEADAPDDPAASPGPGGAKKDRRPNLTIDMFKVTALPDGKVLASGRIVNKGLGRARKRGVLRFSMRADASAEPTPVTINTSEVVGRKGRILKLKKPAKRVRGLSADGGYGPVPIRRGISFDVVLDTGVLDPSRSVIIEAKVDADDRLEETDETDNIVTSGVDLGVDLAVLPLQIVTSQDQIKQITVKTRVQNKGLVASPAFAVGFFVHVPADPTVTTTGIADATTGPVDAPAPGGGGGTGPYTLIRRIDQPAVGPGATGDAISISFQEPPGAEGKNLEISFVIDPSDAGFPLSNEQGIKELDKDNNQVSAYYTFPAPMVDLQARGFEAERDGATLKLRSDVENTGTQDAPAFTGRYYLVTEVPGQPPTRTPISEELPYPAIAARSTLPADQNPEFVWSPPANQERQSLLVELEVDAANAVAEFGDVDGPGGKVNAVNNRFVMKVTLPGFKRPDLAVTSLNRRVTDRGKSVVLRTRVRNLGEAASPAAKGVWVIRGQEEGALDIPELAPRARTDVLDRKIAVEAADVEKGFIEVAFKVTPAGDDRKTDNDSRSIKAQLPKKDEKGPELAIIEPGLTLVPGNPDTPDKVTLRVVVTNSGDKNLKGFDAVASLEPGGTSVKIANNQPIASGESVTLEHTFTPAEAQFGKEVTGEVRVSYRGRAPAGEGDTEGQADLNESASTDPLTLPELREADVEVENVVVDPATLGKDTVKLQALIRNRGFRTATGLKVEFVVNGLTVEREGTRIRRLPPRAFAGSDEATTRAIEIGYRLKERDPKDILPVEVRVETATVEKVLDNNSKLFSVAIGAPPPAP